MKKLILLIVGAIIVVACNNKTPEPKTEFVPVPGDTTVIVIPGDTVVVRDTVIITPGIPIGPSTPISVHPVKQIEGYDTLKVAKDGVVVGIIKSNETVSAWKKVDTQKKLSEYTMEIDATSSYGKSFVNVYLTKYGEDKLLGGIRLTKESGVSEKQTQ
ncbi:hypothetical protein MY04_4630 [Flammeovirga sp. MY04]|uniref:hypothetical protein n=1 Tax=Flammeovirga sp. MY04 TaxID=1191459 RepID=UPI0008061746|nr:hypothetical protein [Flammeovirga sp. MY04]ANQ51965.1 hypothetical protein MY04_4630 [Flammeovirga sp. MY04]